MNYKKAAIIFISFIFILLLISMAISLFYKDNLIRYLQRYLDQHLITEVQVSDIRFNLFSNFPNATVEMTDVYIKPSSRFNRRGFTVGTGVDTLIYTPSIKINVSLISLLKGDLTVKSVRFGGGMANILIDIQGRSNFQIWAAGNGKDTSRYDIKLQQVIFSHFRINYLNKKENIHLEGYTRRMLLRTRLTSDISQLDGGGDLLLYHFQVKDVTLAPGNKVSADVDVTFSPKKIAFNHMRLQSGKAVVNITGYYTGGSKPFFELKAGAGNADIGTLLGFIPEGSIPTGLLSAGGIADIEGFVRGDPGKDPGVEIYFYTKTKKAFLMHVTNRRRIAIPVFNASFHTVLLNEKNRPVLKVDTFLMRSGKGHVGGNLILMPGTQVRGSVSGKIDARELTEFIPKADIREASGTALFALNFSKPLGTTDGIAVADYISSVNNGWIKPDKVAFAVNSAPLYFSSVTGEIILGEQHRVESLSFTLADCEYSLSGTIQHLGEYLAKRGKLIVEADLQADFFDLDKLTGGSSSPGGGMPVFFPDNVEFNGRCQANKFQYGKFTSDAVVLSLRYQPGLIGLDKISFRFPDGNAEGAADLKPTIDGGFSIACNMQLRDINIQRLFWSVNNFSQAAITDKSLRGKVSGSVLFKAAWDSSLNFLPASIESMADIEIVNGQLTDYEPMLGLSKFIAIDELRDIRFKTLRNRIVVYDGIVSIPEMNIHSSAFNIQGSGQHKFSNHYEYQLQVELNDLLARKARRNKKEIEEFGPVEEDGLGRTKIPLRIRGYGTDYQVSFDRGKAVRNVRQNLTEEKEEFKDLFRRQRPAENTSPDSEPQHAVEPGDADNDDKKGVTFEKKEKTKQKKNPEFIIEWDE